MSIKTILIISLVFIIFVILDWLIVMVNNKL